MTRHHRRPRGGRDDLVRRPRRGAFLSVLLAAAYHGAGAAPQPVPQTPADLSRLSIEELAQIEVSSVSRRPERLADAPAAVFVLTRDDIRRQGANTLAEALRLAPNLQVARSRSHTYAITARGFNGESANKLLVLIDGRTVYTPLHSGVFWDAQDVMLADVERIEVVSGPGGTLWGANAVNGVINVITRSAEDTQGTLVSAVAGTQTRGGLVRHGWRAFGDVAVRAYARAFRIDNSVRADGTPVADDWRRRQAGFRADWGPSEAGWTLQGDFHDGRADVPNQPDRSVDGSNLLVRHQRRISQGSEVQVQVYYDTYRRRQPGFFSERLETLDIDVQHQLGAVAGHELVWGGGHREHHDSTEGGALLAFVPARSKLRLTNVFVQDTIALGAKTKLTLGVKAEHNSYTGTETQPNARIAWTPNERSTLWASVSRAVRTPSRLDRDFFVFVNLAPPYSGRLLGGPNFESERVVSYEAGWRSQPTLQSSLSVSAFVNDYDRLRSVEPDGSGAFVLGNGVKARVHGLEAWGSLQMNPSWRLHAGGAWLKERFRFADWSRDPGSPESGANDPRHRWLLRSSWTLSERLSLDLALRRVGALPRPAVAAYSALDARLAWNIRPGLDLSVAAFNLQGDRHAEFGAPAGRSEYERSVMLRLTWQL